MLRDIGFRVYDALWIWIGLQCLCAYLLALASTHQHRLTEVEKSLQGWYQMQTFRKSLP
jgi:hypothetical protein